MYFLDITIPGVPKMLTNLKTNGWRAAHFDKLKWKKLIAAYVDAPKRPPEPIKKASIVCIRATARPSDFDNRVSGFKGIIDGLVEIGVLIDDSDDVLVLRQYPHLKVANKDSHVRIIVEEIA